MHCWQSEQKNPLEALTAELPVGYRLDSVLTETEQLTVLDDFDWAVWRSGGLLVRRGERNLQLYRDKEPLASVSAGPNWRFWWELPDGELTHELKPLVDLRAFVPKFSFRVETSSAVIRNEDDKIVVRLRFVVLNAEPDAVLKLIELEPLRGYDKEYAQIVRQVEQLAGKPLESSDLRSLLPLLGMEVHWLESKPVFGLDPLEPAESAVLRMVETLLDLARQHEQGLLEDIDTEFVHQYRVCIRKARSLLSLFKKCLAPERFARLKLELKEIGSSTNTLRDLDVFLLDHDYYCSLLPTDFRPGLEKIFSRFKRRRTRVLAETVERISSESYQAKVDELFVILREPADMVSTQGRMPISQLVSAKVLKQYRQICRDGLAISSATPDEAVHELRIECKKLRYLLELFAELYPKGKVKFLVGQLKRLQDNLGRFNDYSVQADFLREYGRGRMVPDALASINGLVAVLHNRQLEERDRVEENIAAFAAKNVSLKFERLFAADGQE